MDNYGTHKPAALYEAFSPQEAKRIWDRFEFIYTPKHGSWLNMAEIELRILMGQCLNRRIDTIEEIKSETDAWQSERNNKEAVINWQFTTDKARINLKDFIRQLQVDMTIADLRLRNRAHTTPGKKDNATKSGEPNLWTNTLFSKI